jgi:hypothetical protein
MKERWNNPFAMIYLVSEEPDIDLPVSRTLQR